MSLDEYIDYYKNELAAARVKRHGETELDAFGMSFDMSTGKILNYTTYTDSYINLCHEYINLATSIKDKIESFNVTNYCKETAKEFAFTVISKYDYQWYSFYNSWLIELAKRGYEEVLDDKVSEWHKSPSSETRELYEYLGMTWEEYVDWLKPK